MATFYVSDGYVADGYFQTGVSIDWATRIIFVPQFFLTPLGGTVYQLDTDVFRKALKDLEDSEAGMIFPITHNHNTSVLLGGIEYARIVEITNGYTITFEETGSPYVVNLIGSNNNILDVTNLGTVQIRSNNSAGLINVREVQFNTFLSGVHVDQVSGTTGTAYPAGTPLQPVNNFQDAITIASINGFDIIYINGSASIGVGDDVSGYIIKGQNASKTTITVAPEAETTNCEIYEATVTGTLDNGIVIRDSILDNVDYINGISYNCMLRNTIRLGGVTPAYFLNCYSAATSDSDLIMPVIDFNGADEGQDTSLAIHKWSGYLKLIEKTGGSNAILDVASAEIIIDSSCINGSISCRGTGEVVDSLHVTMPSGTYNGNLVLDNDMIYGEWLHEVWQALELDINPANRLTNATVADAVWDETLSAHLTAGSTGEALDGAGGGGGTVPTAAEIADAVWDEANSAHTTDGTFGHLTNYLHYIEKSIYCDPDLVSNGDGSQENPYNNITDAIDHAEIENITTLYVKSDIALDRNLKNFKIIGIGTPEIDAAGFDLKNSEFHRVRFKGTYTESVIVQESVLETGAYLNGFFENCAVAGNQTTVASSNTYMKNCASAMPNGFTPSFSIASDSTINIVEWYGKLSILGCSTAGSSVIINLVSGHVTIDATCTAGTILITGVGTVVDSSSGATVINNTVDPDILGTTAADIADAVWDEATADHVVAGSFGELVGKKLLKLSAWLGLR